MAEEITQEVFFRLWVNHRSLDEKMSYDSYFFTIAKNISMDIYRKNTIETSYQNYQSKSAEPHSNDTVLQIDFYDLQKLIDEAVDQMPHQQQLVFRYLKLKTKGRSIGSSFLLL